MDISKTDDEIVEECLASDGESFSLILFKYLKTLYSFSYKIVGDKAMAEDITQETFIKVWNNLKKYKISSNFKSWLFSIAHNTAIDYLRKNKELVFSNFDEENGQNIIEDNLSDPLPLISEELERIENVADLENALKLLSPIHREILLLYHSEDVTFEEISKILQKPLNTVKSQYRRALLKLKSIFDAPK
jgi:RNA polymerase sigma-70 factor (ECF subfamily)